MTAREQAAATHTPGKAFAKVIVVKERDGFILATLPYRRAMTMTLAGIVATQVGNVFACRTDRESVFRVGLLANRLVLTGIVAELAILITLILLPPLPYLFGLALLAFPEWGILLLFPPTVLLLEEGRKWIVRRTH